MPSIPIPWGRFQNLDSIWIYRFRFQGYSLSNRARIDRFQFQAGPIQVPTKNLEVNSIPILIPSSFIRGQFQFQLRSPNQNCPISGSDQVMRQLFKNKWFSFFFCHSHDLYTSINWLCALVQDMWGDNSLLASCPWGPVTANWVDLLIEMYVIYI